MPTKNTPSNGKPKVNQVPLPTLVLPPVTRISGDVDSMLESTVAERYKTILLVPIGQKDTSKGTQVLTHQPDTKDPSAQVSTWNEGLGHLLRYTQAMANGWSSGTGYSGDGSCQYVLTHAETVLKAVPNFAKYDLYLVPKSRGGASQYRISIPELMAQVKARASIIVTCVKEYGIAQGKSRTKKSESAPQITTIL